MSIFFLRKFWASWLHGFTDPLSASGTNGFKRAVLRRLVSNKGGEFHLASDQIRCFKFSFEHQCPRVPPDVAEHKFHRTRESDRVSLGRAPLCFRWLGGPPHIQPWIQQQESAFSGALSVKAQGAVLVIGEGDLYVPSADHVWRLRLDQGNAGRLEDQHQNYTIRNNHAQMLHGCGQDEDVF